MYARNEISEELKLLSTIVSGISRETPYQAPADYFIAFPARTLNRLGLTGEVPSFANSIDKPLTFSVPEGYFDGFAENLLNRIKDITPTGELARLSPLLNGISRNLPYLVPANYFEQLSPIMAPLASLRDKPLYAVPETYFDGLAGEIIAKLNLAEKKEPARVISLDRSVNPKKRSLQPSWLKYSVAAAIAGLIITFGWLRLHNPSGGHQTQPTELANNLGTVSDQDLQTYAENNSDQATTESMNSTATLDINDSDVKSLLGDVPDDVLKQYMEEHGGAVDIATN